MTRRHRVPVEKLALGALTLGADASKYVCRVLRVVAGDHLELFEPERAEQALGRVVLSEPSRVVCEIESIEPATNLPTLDVCLLQAMSKGDRVERVIKDATALGVGRIVISATEHATMPPPLFGDTRLERWRRISIEASRQCGRGNIPEISVAGSLSEGRSRCERGFKLFLNPLANILLFQGLDAWQHADAVSIAVGPEGGFSPYEVAEFERHGWLGVGLGPLVLRTELAPIVALAQLSAHAFERSGSPLA